MLQQTFTRRAFLWAFAALLLWITGCSGPRSAVDNRPDLPDAFPYHTLDQIQQQLRSHNLDTLYAVKARASLALHTPEQSGSATARMEHRRSDSLYMSLTGMLGIEGARVLVTPDSFFVYDRLKKQLNYGSLSFASAFLPAPLTGDDVFRNLLGLIYPDPRESWRLETDSAYYHLYDATGQFHYIVDPTVWRVIRYEERSPEGDLVESRTFTEYDVFDNVYLPRRIILQRPVDDTSISIYYRNLSLNPPQLSFALRVGDSVERVLIDEHYGSFND
jgi:hypothetical protein